MRIRLFDLAVTITTSALLSFFVWHGFYGPRGIEHRKQVARQVAALKLAHDEIRDRRMKLEAHVALLRPEAVDPDLVEELSRKTLGFVRANEIIVRMN